MRVITGTGWTIDAKQKQQEQIDKEKFCKYEAYRQIGITNMYDIQTISAFTNLPNVDIHLIQSYYDNYTKLYYDEELINHYKECIDEKTLRIQDVFLETI